MSVKLNSKALRIRMIEMGMSLSDLSNASGVHENTIRNAMNGKGFTSDTLGKIALALNLNPTDLIDAEGFVSSRIDTPAVSV